MGGNLVINSPVKEQHVGNYSCLAANAFGTVISREASVQFGCRWRRCETRVQAAVMRRAELTEHLLSAPPHACESR